jgi:hypothetical protein
LNGSIFDAAPSGAAHDGYVTKLGNDEAISSMPGQTGPAGTRPDQKDGATYGCIDQS